MPNILSVLSLAATTIYPAFAVGYRYQNPKGGLAFRQESVCMKLKLGWDGVFENHRSCEKLGIS